MPFAYYNEFDKSAAEWLRQLIKEGAITDGVVDERSIEDVVPTELAEFDRCHFFAGIGAWDYALTAAGWRDGDGQTWTGSCPCQPFSSAGKGEGFADERHLWPAWFHLIQQCRPRVIFGEQVSSKDTMPWIDLVHADLEGALYTVGAADLCSPSVGAPHIRQRLYFVARDMADTGELRRRRRNKSGSGSRELSAEGSSADYAHDLADTDSGESRGQHRETSGTRQEVRLRDGSDAEHGGGIGQLGNADSERSQRIRDDNGTQGREDSQRPTGLPDGAVRTGVGLADTEGTELAGNFTEEGRSMGYSPTNGFWRNAEWIYCRDGKYRPVGTVEPGSFEVADVTAADLGYLWDQSGGRYTISPLIEKGRGRVVRLRGYGNAIVPEVAIEWIKSYLDR